MANGDREPGAEPRAAEAASTDDALLRAAAVALGRACPGCREVLAELEAILRHRLGRDPAWAPVAWEAGRLGFVDPRRLLPRAYRAAAREIERLRPLAAARRWTKLRHSRPRARTPALVEAFLEESRALLRADPGQALEWLDLADYVVVLLPAGRHSEGVIATLALRTAAHRANALRVAGDLAAAEAIFRRLHGDPRRRLVAERHVRGELASLEASLRQDQRRLPEAEVLLAQAVADYRAAGDAEGCAKALMKEGLLGLLRGEPAAALPVFREAAAAADPKRSPRLHLQAQHNLALCLCQLGDHAGAAALLAAHRAAYEGFGDREALALLAWLEGRLAAGRGDAEAAESHLLDARNQYLGHGLGFDAALVTLDLAEAYVGQGRTAEVQRLTAATVAVFAGREVHAEAARALALFHRAAAAERVTLELIARFRTFFERRQERRGPVGRLPA